ncbi:MAG: hypothetical protein KAG97_10595 [Victivallales bacterium]|nr:hypothetical protein [Victivallales bacterium]
MRRKRIGTQRTIEKSELHELERLLRIRGHSDLEVTISDSGHKISQVYCSALPIAYCGHSKERVWNSFARLILDASYEATFNASIINSCETGNNTLFLTLLDGGAFGNRKEWIIDAIEQSMNKHIDSGLDVAVVSYGYSDPLARELTRKFRFL